MEKRILCEYPISSLLSHTGFCVRECVLTTHKHIPFRWMSGFGASRLLKGVVTVYSVLVTKPAITIQAANTTWYWIQKKSGRKKERKIWCYLQCNSMKLNGNGSQRRNFASSNTEERLCIPISACVDWQRHNTSIVWHSNSHERQTHVMSVWGLWESEHIVKQQLSNTHLFNVRSRMNCDPKAWSWNEAWARWTSYGRKEKKSRLSIRPDARMTDRHCLQINSLELSSKMCLFLLCAQNSVKQFHSNICLMLS